MGGWRKIILSVFILMVMAFAAFYYLVYNKPHTDYSKQDADIEISAVQLYQDFTHDEQLASQKYTGKVIIIEGIPDYIEEPQDMVIAGFIFQEGLFGGEGIRCTMLGGYREQLDNAIKNELPLKIKGLCVGYNGSDVVVEHCSLPEIIKE